MSGADSTDFSALLDKDFRALLEVRAVEESSSFQSPGL